MFTQHDGCYKCWVNMYRVYKIHSDGLYKQTGQAGPDDYWKSMESQVKNVQKVRQIFERIDSIIGGEKAVEAPVLESDRGILEPIPEEI